MRYLIDLKETVDVLKSIDDFLEHDIKNYKDSFPSFGYELSDYRNAIRNLKDYFTYAMKSNTHLAYTKEDDADHFAGVGKMINGAEIAK